MPRAMQISDSEWDVMEPIWETGPCTAAEVIKRLRATHDWNHSTIRTLLARLVEKGVLDYEVDGARYVYRAAVSRRRCVRQKGRSFLNKVFGGDVGALLAHFVENASLDRDQFEQLQQLLAQRRKPKEKRK
ncbi:MAG TPA: BlaI/MecI/CopY family transcriptional regulator [Pirellulales bacterium]|nr:BlaI/MecI/CopY family transcriptional regulator [Pirellulales bacterium]